MGSARVGVKIKLNMELTKTFSQFQYVVGSVFQWSPATSTITFIESQVTNPSGQLSLLHEISHGLLGHQQFESDIQLVRMEVEAWMKTKQIASEMEIPYDDSSVEHCLDTYRDWLDARSRCPDCDQTGLQQSNQKYRCVACGELWRVPLQQSCTVKRFRFKY